MKTIGMGKTLKNISVAIILGGSLFFTPDVSANDMSAENVIRELNEARIFAGLPPLVKNEKLSRAAEEKIQDMVTNDYFEHTSPGGIEPWYWLSRNGYAYTRAGENLAMNFKTATAQQSAWMKSPTHRKNILNPGFQEIGVAVGYGMISGRVTTIAVQEFGARKDFPAFAQENGSEMKNIKKTFISGGNFSGEQKAGLTLSAYGPGASYAGRVGDAFSVISDSGWTTAFAWAVLCAMGAASAYLAFDIHRIRKNIKIAEKMSHWKIYHSGDGRSIWLSENFTVRPINFGFKNHYP